jgi:hypothetical protein
VAAARAVVEWTAGASESGAAPNTLPAAAGAELLPVVEARPARFHAAIVDAAAGVTAALAGAAPLTRSPAAPARPLARTVGLWPTEENAAALRIAAARLSHCTALLALPPAAKQCVRATLPVVTAELCRGPTRRAVPTVADEAWRGTPAERAARRPFAAAGRGVQLLGQGVARLALGCGTNISRRVIDRSIRDDHRIDRWTTPGPAVARPVGRSVPGHVRLVFSAGGERQGDREHQAAEQPRNHHHPTAHFNAASNRAPPLPWSAPLACSPVNRPTRRPGATNRFCICTPPRKPKIVA